MEQPKTATRSLTLALAFKGYREGPRDNETRFGAWSGYQYQAWCASFTSWVLDTSGLSMGKIAYVPTAVNWYRARSSIFTAPQRGDQFFIWSASKGRHAHTGFVLQPLGGNRYQTIEGNSNTDGSFNGIEVVSIVRTIKPGDLFGRPAYETEVSVADQNPNVEAQAPIAAFQAIVLPDGRIGYYVVTTDGAVFAFGAAEYRGRVHFKGQA